MKRHHLFLIGWTVVNLLHALYAELIDDEAYYWVYAQFPALGYFDHPPMTAWWISAGYAALQRELGVRLLFVLAGTGVLWAIWSLLDRPVEGFWRYVILVCSVLMVHFGSVLAVPDAPLGFFVALFWLLLKRFLDRESWLGALGIGLTLAAMAYSKYHGALVVVFTLAALPGLLRNPKLWFSAALAALLIAPHLWWQHAHDWVTFRFHLVERQGSDPFQWKYLGEYIGGQLGLFGPLMAIPLFWLAFRYTPANQIERAMRWNGIGFLGLFFLMSFKGHPEANWTSPATVPILVLAFRQWNRQPATGWLRPLALSSLLLILFARATMVVDFFPDTFFITRQFHGYKAWATTLRDKTAGHPALFSNTYQKPSKYMFYSGVPAAPQNNYGRNRRNQFDYLPLLEHMRGKTVAYMECTGDGCDSLPARPLTTRYRLIENFQIYPRVEMTPLDWPAAVPAQTTLRLPVSMYNPYPFDIDYNSCPGFQPRLGAACSKDKRARELISSTPIHQPLHPSGATLRDTLVVHTPSVPGHYFIVFGIRYDNEAPGRNAPPYSIAVY